MSNWTLLLIGFSIAVLMGAGAAALLTQLRPDWSVARRLVIAASALPAITLGATLIGLLIVGVGPDAGGDVKGTALTIVAIVGGGFALLGLIGGLIGASLALRRRRRG
jgi:hypothetical protein